MTRPNLMNAAIALLSLTLIACVQTCLASDADSDSANISYGLEAPRIDGIEALDDSRAVIWWDSVHESAASVNVLARAGRRASWQEIGQADARAGYCILRSLQDFRDYELQLEVISTAFDSAFGEPFAYTHRDPKLHWVFFPATEFSMGSHHGDESPVHNVRLTPFLIGATEVTNIEYMAFCDAAHKPYPADPGFASRGAYFYSCPRCPVVQVNWHDAVEFCKWFSTANHTPVRLPTEAEWEFAAQHGNPMEIPDNSTVANYLSDSLRASPAEQAPQPVAGFASKGNGLFDMAGNVWEWCQDGYAPYGASDSAVTNPSGANSASWKVIRGGSWADPATALRVTNRDRLAPQTTLSTVGFRVARSLPIGPVQVYDGKLVRNETK